MAEPSTVSVVIPAFNEEAAVGRLVEELRAQAHWHEILVVDDGSSDETAARAQNAGARIIRHPYNKGNGAAVKSGIRQSSGDFVLIIDGDGQHRAADALRLISHLGEYDLVVGARAPATHATITRRIGNSALNRLASYLTGRRVPDLTSGFRAARRRHLREFLHLLPNGFSTPTTTTLAFLKAGYDVHFEPVDAEVRLGQSKIRLLRDGAKFLIIALRVVTIFSPMRVFAPVAGLAAVLGSAYGIWTAVADHKIPNGAVLLLMFAVIVFLVGLVSEQIAALRLERHD